MIIINKSDLSDRHEILALQKRCYRQEAEIYDDYSIPPLTQTIEEITEEFKSCIVLKAENDKRIIGSVRAYIKNNVCFIGRLIVDPDFQNQGIGAELMNKIEKQMNGVYRFELFTGEKSLKNIYLYEKLGYKIFKKEKLNNKINIVFLEKINSSMHL